MATVATQLNSGSGFASGEIVTATKLNSLVNTATVAGIVNADIDASAAISLSKLNLGSGITSSQIADGAVTGAAGGGKLAASAITGQTTIADALADGDEFLVHDASASALRKVSYSSIAPTVTAAKLDGVAKNNAGTNLTPGNPPIFGCRAFVNFDGTKDTTGAASTANTNRFIRAAGNVSSVLRNSQGKYTITFTTNMPDVNYVVVGNAAKDDNSDDGNFQVQAHGWQSGASGADTVSSTRIVTAAGTALRDSGVISVAIFR